MDRQLKRIESNMATKDDLRAMDNRFKGIERHLADQDKAIDGIRQGREHMFNVMGNWMGAT